MYVWFAMAADAAGHMYFGSVCDGCQPGETTGKDPDTIGYTTHFWQEFEIRENRGNIFQLTDRY